MCSELLKKAELYVQTTNPRIRALTYNNYACLFRKTKKFRNALQYLEKALELEYNCINFGEDEKEPNEHDEEEEYKETSVEKCLIISNPCEIHLNICAILSQMGKHELALHHAMKALILIQDELSERIDMINGGSGEPKSMSSEVLAENPQQQERFNVLVAALHNIAVEHEYLQQFTISLQYYQKSRDFSVQTLGPSHPMSVKMDKVYIEAATKIEKILTRQYQRKIMAGQSLKLRKGANMELDQINKTKKNLTDIINSGLAQMDIENTYTQQFRSPRNNT